MTDIRLGAGNAVNNVDIPIGAQPTDPVDNVTTAPWPHGEKAGMPKGPDVFVRAHGVAGGKPCRNLFITTVVGDDGGDGDQAGW